MQKSLIAKQEYEIPRILKLLELPRELKTEFGSEVKPI